VLHVLPSSHVVPLATLPLLQPVAGVHASLVQVFESSQLGAGPATQAPVSQRSAPLQMLTSAHEVPFVLKPSVGQAVPAPEHVSSTSQTLAATRQTVPALPAGCEQAPLPSQTSTVHFWPSSAHVVPDGLNTSAGQVPSAPVHVSAASQDPAAVRHTVPALPGG
jgi:hypothetical protein